MMVQYKLSILSLGVNCSWVAPGMKSAGTRSLWTKTEDVRGAGENDESNNNFIRMWRKAFSLLLKAEKSNKIHWTWTSVPLSESLPLPQENENSSYRRVAVTTRSRLCDFCFIDHKQETLKRIQGKHFLCYWWKINTCYVAKEKSGNKRENRKTCFN